MMRCLLETECSSKHLLGSVIETAIGKRRSAVISWVATFSIYIVRALARQVMALATATIGDHRRLPQ